MSLNQKLAAAAAALAALALLVGSRTPRTDFDLAALARAVEREEDHVDALELAEWIRAQKANLRIVDVRTEQEYNDFHIPRAEHVPLGRITEFEPRTGEVVVLYSAGGTHGAQAWFFLKARGVRDVFFLRGGLNEWLDDVMSPPASADARTRELSAYFGGRPGASVPDATVDEKIRRVKGRTC